MQEKSIGSERLDSEGNPAPWQPGDKAYLLPRKCYVTISKQRMCYDGPEYFWGNCEIIFDDGVKGECNSWQLRKDKDV